MSNFCLNNFYNNYKNYFYQNFIENDHEYSDYNNFQDTVSDIKYQCISAFN